MFRIDRSRRVAGLGAVVLLGGVLIGALGYLTEDRLRLADGGDQGAAIDPDGAKSADGGDKGAMIDPDGCKRAPQPATHRSTGALPLV